MTVKTFADTSAVSVAYAIDAAADETELTATEFSLIPFTQENFTMGKESQQSSAITGDRRVKGQKNTSGSASGGWTTEMGLTPFVMDFFQLAAMNAWEVDSLAADGSEFLYDSDQLQYFVAEKRIAKETGGVLMNYLQRYYGNLVNEFTISFSRSELVTVQVSSMSVFADTAKADATLDEMAGSMATTYTVPTEYEIVDAANNLKNIVLKDSTGTPLDVTFASDLTITISNNVREQPAVNSMFSAGMAAGKVNASLSGTAYFYDDTVLREHMDNGTLAAEITLESAEGTMVLNFPALKAGNPSANAQGENQDYSESLELTAQEGEVTLGSNPVRCTFGAVFTPAP